jgi:DNA-binding transcriptional ArsR family regulator
MLADGEKTAGELGEGFAVSQPAISKHLRVLREAGLVSARPKAQARLYHLTPAPLADVHAWLTSLWQDRLNSLQVHVEGVGGPVSTPNVVRYPGRPLLPNYPRSHHLRAIRVA